MYVTSCFGHLGNISSLSYVALPNVDTFHYIYQNSHLLISPLSIRQVLIKY